MEFNLELLSRVGGDGTSGTFLTKEKDGKYPEEQETPEGATGIGG